MGHKPDNSPAEPVVVSWPSAVGKTYLVKHLAQQYQAERLLATTTKTMRPGEVDMVDSHFLSEDEFAMQQSQGKLFLASGFLGARYAFEHSLFNKIVEQSSIPLVEIYSPKIVSFLGEISTSKTVFLKPPSLDYLEERMVNRGQSADEVAYRMAKVAEEMAYFEGEGQQYYSDVYTLTPETFDDTAQAIASKMQFQARS